MDGFVPYRHLLTPPEKAARAEIVLEFIGALNVAVPSLKDDLLAIIQECRDEHRANAALPVEAAPR